MAKFFKSIFNSGDRRKSAYDGDEDEKTLDSPPPMDGKRQLSISRSGRMRQANKKRHSLTLELYGDTIQKGGVEKLKSVEYHVHGPISQMTAPVTISTREKRLEVKPDNEGKCLETNLDEENVFQVSLEKKLNALALENSKSPEEEIDNAFENIDKS